MNGQRKCGICVHYSTTKKNEIMSLTGKWMELEVIILSKIERTQNDKYHVFSHMLNIAFFKDMKGEGELFRKWKGTSGREDKRGKWGEVKNDQSSFIHMYENIMMKPIILYN
jgi:hypothetical protein